MKALDLVVGTVSGTAKSVALYLGDRLNDQFTIKIHEYPDLQQIIREPKQLIVFCVSNIGVGELPPTMRRVYVQLTQQNWDLSQHEFAIINLGDSHYPDYCKSGHTLNKVLKGCRAKSIAPPFAIDASRNICPNQEAWQWLHSILRAQNKIK